MFFKHLKKTERISWIVLLLGFVMVAVLSCSEAEDPQPNQSKEEQQESRDQLLELIGAIDS